ncbi:hypothetical protein At15955_27010 [Agrobacterium tumefaciens]|nr:integrase [Agrobacterium tumefaciens]AYM17686.1 hypothetical protein At15955_27010 [Agrobacterium tumefaciens]AYM68985.1 hypothetical protein AtA6_27690 [Agrobacterium tumefaciens]
MGDNTLRALISDLAYLEAWGLAITGNSLPWPAPEALLLKFVAITSGTRKNAQQVPTTACQLRSMKTSGVGLSEIRWPARAVDGVGRWGTVSKRALDPQSVNAIIKQRAEMAGLDAAEFSEHGLRSGYLTEAANRGIPLPEAM